MGYAVIPKFGMVETTEAKLIARFGKPSGAYLRMLGEKPVPAHVRHLAERYRQSKFWEVPVEEPKPEIPPCPSIEEVDVAITNLRALAGHAQGTGGPVVAEELVKLAVWIKYLNANARGVT